MSATTVPGPRLFGICATAAPVVAVVRRGPSDWFHVGRWDLAEPHYAPGAWFKGTLYPQKCDVSPDGRWFAYSALKYGVDWPAGDIYEAVSRLPWLTALAAWNTGTTYGRGFHFTDSAGVSNLGPPDVGDDAALLARYGLQLYRPQQFAVERLRGWQESADSPPRAEGGPWDESRHVAVEKPQPLAAQPWTLRVEGGFAGFRTMPGYHSPAAYSLHRGDQDRPLQEVQWADWDATGRLLIATRAGQLQIRSVEGGKERVLFSEDLSLLRPEPAAPPAWAEEW